MAFLAYHLHWPLAELLDLPHRERRSWVGEVSSINSTLNSAEHTAQNASQNAAAGA